MADEFNPNRSRVADNTLADFLRAPLTGKLLEVPGIGPATSEIFKQNGITTTYGLIGKYLMLKEEDVEPVEHAQRFYLWIQSIDTYKKIKGYRAGIVHSIAEKVNTSFIGLYNADDYA